LWFYLFGYNSEKINKANSKINSNIKSGKKSLSGDFYFNLTVGLATAGDSLLFWFRLLFHAFVVDEAAADEQEAEAFTVINNMMTN
jgi:hypothetical protein